MKLHYWLCIYSSISFILPQDALSHTLHHNLLLSFCKIVNSFIHPHGTSPCNWIAPFSSLPAVNLLTHWISNALCHGRVSLRIHTSVDPSYPTAEIYTWYIKTQKQNKNYTTYGRPPLMVGRLRGRELGIGYDPLV